MRTQQFGRDEREKAYGEIHNAEQIEIDRTIPQPMNHLQIRSGKYWTSEIVAFNSILPVARN